VAPPGISQDVGAPLGALQLEDGGIGAGLLSSAGVSAPASSMSLVDALGRIASALERGGADDTSGAAGAAAAAAVAAAKTAVAEAPMNVTAPMNNHVGAVRAGHELSDRHSNGMVAAVVGMKDQLTQRQASSPQMMADVEARMARIERSLADVLCQGVARDKPGQEGLEATPAHRTKSSEIDTLTARCGRLEHEVAELRAQVARRLDAAARDAAASRREAEEARAEASTLRSEVADLMAQLLQAPPPAISHRSDAAAISHRSDAASSVTSGPPFTGRTGASVGMQDASVRESIDAVDSGTIEISPRNLGGTPHTNGQVDDADQAQALPSSVKFVPAPLMASENVGNGSGPGPGFSRQILPGVSTRMPARGSLGRGAGTHAGVSATSHAGTSAKH